MAGGSAVKLEIGYCCTMIGYRIPERETYGMLLFIQLLQSCLLRRGKSATCYHYSYTLTYRILLSPTSQRLAVRPFSPERETFCMLSLSATFSFGIKKHTKCPITPSWV